MLAQRVRGIQPSGIRRIFELVASMEDPINLSIGQAHYDPPEELVEAACRAIRSGLNRYTVTQGLPALNQRVLDMVETRCGHRPEASLITAGVSGGLVLGFLCLLDPGDEILLPDPGFTMYRVLAELCGATVRHYDLYPRWQPDPAEIEALVGPRTKIVFLNSPSNPTGGVLEQCAVDALVAAAARVGAYVVADEIYDFFLFEPQRFGGSLPTPLGRYDRVLQLGGFSKTYGVPGWRMGYATGPADLLDTMMRVQQFSFVCAPAPFQYAIAEVAFDLDLRSHVDDYRNKRDRIVRELDPAYRLVPPEGSFYAFPELPGIEESAFVEAAIAHKLLIVPGSAFSRRKSHFRLSFAASDVDLARGITALNDIATCGLAT